MSPEACKRYELVLKLREEDRLIFREIGRRLSISRTRAHQIYHIAQRRKRRAKTKADQ